MYGETDELALSGCPFCGSLAVKVIEIAGATRLIALGCCDASGPPVPEARVSDALIAWNRRAFMAVSDAPPAGEPPDD